MKRLLYIGLVLFSGLSLTGCDKETEWTAEANNVPAERQAFLKINYVSNYAANPSVHLTVNDIRVSNLITARTPFPGGGYNTGGSNFGDYLSVRSGPNKVSVAIPHRNYFGDSVLLYTTNLTLEPNMYYTLHITDTASKTKQLLTVDDLTQPEAGQTRFRFINLMPNVAAVDLYYGTTKVASNIPYLTSSTYITMAVPTTALAWSIREAGASATSTALATYTSANTTLSQRVYTAFALGYKSSSDAARRPYISFYLNK